MSIDSDMWVTDYYDYPDPTRMVEHDVPYRPTGDLYNTIHVEDMEDMELV